MDSQFATFRQEEHIGINSIVDINLLLIKAIKESNLPKTAAIFHRINSSAKSICRQIRSFGVKYA